MRTMGIGVQDFSEIRERDFFYVDKTKFMKEWWRSGAKVTLLTRPRRFGKTLTMSMVERFFSVQYAGQGEIFKGLEVEKDEDFMKLQGSYPVISFTFSGIKKMDYKSAVGQIRRVLQNLYRKYHFILDSGCFDHNRLRFFEKMENDMEEEDIPNALRDLSEMLYIKYGKKVIILLDEYDTPTQEAFLNQYWDDLVLLFSELFDYTFKTNEYLERGIITGITRISRESLFSGLNNLKVITMTSDKYADIFGFTEDEVAFALDEMGLASDREQVREWYDGYRIGGVSGIYNPWSIINYLDEKKIAAYWVNTSSNSLAGEFIQKGSGEVKKNMESLLRGEPITVSLDEEIVFSQLDQDEDAIWSLLLASGYLRVIHKESVLQARRKKTEYQLELANMEIRVTFADLISGWFGGVKGSYHGFLEALLSGDVEEMNECLNEISERVFSYFDTRQREPERFYHGFLLGLCVDLERDYVLTSNRESGKGRYDVVIEPKQEGKNAIIIEFKTVKPNQSLENAVETALAQIEEKQYEMALLARGFARDRIKKYGFAFAGKKVLIGQTACL